MTRIFMQCYEAVENSIADDGDTYRVRSALFMDLVSKRDYPVYYTMIQNPIAMKIIKKRIHSSYYKTVSQFRDDFHLMFNNARIFNEEGSFVYQDADEMQVCIFATSCLSMITPEFNCSNIHMVKIENFRLHARESLSWWHSPAAW